MTTFLVVTAALLLDALFGEPRRHHPLVGFGKIAATLEHHFHTDSRLRGSMVLLLLLAPPILLTALLSSLPWVGVLFDITLLYLAIGWNSLQLHARRVADALAAGKHTEARRVAGLLVSRDTADLDEEAISRATVESVLENGNDALFAAIFWFLLAGAPGVVGYRLANTLDAMWGYRNGRYRRFGWAAARLDDLLNLIPARLTATAYLLAGKTRKALRCWRTQASGWSSPNAGVVMATGAGSLGIRLGGIARYDGVVHCRPFLGTGRSPETGDIERALALVRHAVFLWLAVLSLGGTLVENIL